MKSLNPNCCRIYKKTRIILRHSPSAHLTLYFTVVWARHGVPGVYLPVPGPPGSPTTDTGTTGHLSWLRVCSALLTSPGVRMVVSRGIPTIAWSLPPVSVPSSPALRAKTIVWCHQERFQERFQRLLGRAYKKMYAHGRPGEENRCGVLARNR